jgi:hypothetical protein
MSASATVPTPVACQGDGAAAAEPAELERAHKRPRTSAGGGNGSDAHNSSCNGEDDLHGSPIRRQHGSHGHLRWRHAVDEPEEGASPVDGKGGASGDAGASDFCQGGRCSSGALAASPQAAAATEADTGGGDKEPFTGKPGSDARPSKLKVGHGSALTMAPLSLGALRSPMA